MRILTKRVEVKRHEDQASGFEVVGFVRTLDRRSRGPLYDGKEGRVYLTLESGFVSAAIGLHVEEIHIQAALSAIERGVAEKRRFKLVLVEEEEASK
jgi:hypothetical protein